MTTIAGVACRALDTPAERKLYFSGRGADGTEHRPEIVLNASDLGAAQRERRRIMDGCNGVAPLVMLRLEGLLADTFTEARTHLTEYRGRRGADESTVRYVGTPAGLAGLIADIGAAEVADGVILVPLDAPGSSDLIARHTIPSLRERGMRIEEGASV
ncbi:hypothetical protein VZC37_22015 [Gordonia sp. LSe1-13]|uniref:Uncharacterized protein n=1 Tax=Gordonia sesuvii TaxID=3116777 RepID=A0ABU7MJJ2_9ACTN|nr:hypothetical protein [Gordonia sp. LSe1-13]